MKAALINRFGPPEVLMISEVPAPPVGDFDVLIRTKVIGLNFADIFARLGFYPGIPKPPFVPGIEISGVVEKKGKAPGRDLPHRIHSGVRGGRPGDAQERCAPGSAASPGG